jgi:hypothetical protein
MHMALSFQSKRVSAEESGLNLNTQPSTDLTLSSGGGDGRSSIITRSTESFPHFTRNRNARSGPQTTQTSAAEQFGALLESQQHLAAPLLPPGGAIPRTQSTMAAVEPMRPGRPNHAVRLPVMTTTERPLQQCRATSNSLAAASSLYTLDAVLYSHEEETEETEEKNQVEALPAKAVCWHDVVVTTTRYPDGR